MAAAYFSKTKFQKMPDQYTQIKAIIYFANDPSVGIFPNYYTAEIPPFEPEYREETRQMIQKLYTELEGEFYPKVFFSDEDIN